MPFVAHQVKHTQLNTQEVLSCIRSVICDTDIPSWLGSVPSNFGDKAAATIKADEWRTLVTVYLPIALISLWGLTGQRDDVAPDLRAVLDHTMDLVCTVYLACVCTTSNNRATAYQAYITSYIGKLKAIYPTFSV